MISDHEKENRGNRSSNSWGHPPKWGSKGYVGRQLTLLEIKHQQNNQHTDSSRDIMKAHTHQTAKQNTVDMVVYHQPYQYNNYPHNFSYTPYM